MSDLVNIQSLIEAGKVIQVPSDVDVTKTFVQVGVYQEGNRTRGASNANSYAPAVIPLSLLIGGGSTYTGSNGITLVGNDFRLATGAASLVWAPNGNTFGAEKFLGTIDNFALPFRTNNTEIARFTTAGDLVIGTATPLARTHIRGKSSLYTDYALLVENSGPTSAFLVDNIGRVIVNYPGAALDPYNYPYWGHTFASATSGAADISFSIGNSGLSRSLFIIRNNGSFEMGDLAGPVSVFAGNGVDSFSFSGAFVQKLGVNTTTPIANLHVTGPGSSTTILGSVLDNIGGWFHVVTVGAGNGLLFLEAGASTNDVTAFRLGVTGGATGGGFTVYNNTGSGKVIFSGAVGSSRVLLNTDAGAPAFEVTNVGDAVFSNMVAMTGLQVGNAGLVSGDLYIDTAANILTAGDWVVGMKV